MRMTPGLAVIAVIATALAQPPARSAAEMEPLLAKISTYEYGRSREALAQLSLFVEGAMGSGALLQEIEARLLKFLQSDATAAAKEAVLKELSLIATVESVPVLTAMMVRAETSEMARYALARIPGPAPDDALRKALDGASGKVKIGIVNSLGQRRDAKAVPALRVLASSSDSRIAEAAIFALGNIPSRQALDALAAASRDPSGPLRQRVLEAYLQCAGGLAAHGDKNDALKIYRQFSAPQESDTVRIAALTGLATLEGKNAIPALGAALDSESPRVQAAAIKLLAGIPGPDTTTAMAGKFQNLPPSGQVRLLTALAQRGDVSAGPLLLQAAKAGTTEVRVAGLSGLGKMGDENSVILLAEAAASGQGKEQIAARESLSALKGRNVDAAIVKGISLSSPKLKTEFILAAGERRSPDAADVLIQAVREPDPDVRRAALRALKNVAGSAQVPGLLEALKTTDAGDRKEAAQALTAALKKSQPAQMGAVISAYQASTFLGLNLSLLEVMGQTSSAEALDVLRECLKDSNPEIVRGAILALTGWADSTPLQDLLALARSRPEPTLQTLSLRGYLKLLTIPSRRSNPDSARLLGEGIQLAREPAEKRTALGLLPAYACEEALKVAEGSLKDETVAAEAKASVERIRNVLKVR